MKKGKENLPRRGATLPKASINTDKGLEIVQKEQERRQKDKTKKSKIVKKKTDKNLKLMKTARETKKTRKYTKTMVFVTFIVIGIIIYKNYHKLGIVFNKDININDATVITRTSSNNIIRALENEILVYSSGTYVTYNKYGKETWKTKLDATFIPEICTAGSYIQIINKDSGYVYIYNNKYESARLKIDGKIKSGIITDDGISIIEYSETGSKTILGVYNNNGNEKYKIKLNTNTISQYAMSDNEKYLAYTEVQVDGISLSTSVGVVNLSSADNGEDEIPVVFNKENELSYKMFFDGNKLIIFFENGVAVYNASTGNTVQHTIPHVNLLNIDIGVDRYVYTSLSRENKAQYMLSQLKYGDTESNDIILNETPNDIYYKQDLIYLSYKKKISVYNKFGMNIKKYNSETILTTPTIFNDGKSVAVTTSNKIIIFTI